MVQGIELVLLGTGLGFGLAVVWDLWKSWRLDRKEVDRIRWMLVTELGENRQTALALIDYLQKDLAALQEGRELSASTFRLSDEGWAIARGAKIHCSVDGETLRKLVIVYTLTKQANMIVTNRETFRSTSRALSGYAKLLMSIDSALIERLNALIRVIEEAARYRSAAQAIFS